MLSVKELEQLLNSPESSVLDFKVTMYDLSRDSENNNSAKIIKDVISFTNTIRTQTSYIVIGVEEKDDGSKGLVGIDKRYDDAIFQDKVKDKANPKPNFLYYNINYQDKVFGIFEFPVTKYQQPVSPTEKMKGLVAGQVYFRRGSSNTEATGQEVISIHTWLQSLPQSYESLSILDESNALMKNLMDMKRPLSQSIADMYRFSKKYNVKDLEEFCIDELQGFENEKAETKPDNYRYRVQKVIISLLEIQSFTGTASMLKLQMKEKGDFLDYQMLFDKPLQEVEEFLERFRANSNTVYATIKVDSKNVFRGKKIGDYKVNVYIFFDTYQNLYQSIRQKAIDLLIGVQN